MEGLWGLYKNFRFFLPLQEIRQNLVICIEMSSARTLRLLPVVPKVLYTMHEEKPCLSA